jgi:hypothetical protein
VHIPNLIDKVKQFATDNSTALLTGAGSVGVVSTAYLSSKAGFRAAHVIEQEERQVLMDSDGLSHGSLRFLDRAKLVWPLYIPTVTSGTITVASIVMGNRMASKQVAALTLASGISERALQEYKAKVVEKLGENKDVAVREAIAQDKVDKAPLNTREVILAGTGEVLCFDIYSGRYFQSSVEEIKKAENKINFGIINHGYASLTELYDEIGLPPTGISDDVGWNLDNQLTIHFATTMSSDGRPCVTIDFAAHPQPNYNRFH